LSVLRRNGFFDFSAHYFSTHDTKLAKNWEPDEAMLEQLHDYLMQQGVTFTEADWTRDHDWLRNELQQEMDVTAFSYEESQKVAVEEDPEVQKAISAMPQASHLLAESKSRYEKQRASLR
jgi:hypothetical protein